MIDPKKIADGFRLILEGIGENPDRPGLRGTPDRIAELYKDIFSGIDRAPGETLSLLEGEGFDEMVALAGVPFYSMCEHHFLPFFGRAHMAYIPNENRMTGLSELGRVLDLFAKRPQIQERLTSQLADGILDILKPQGVMVVLEAEHLCLSMRGIKKAGVPVVTSAVRGSFRKNAKTRQEFLSFIRMNGAR